MALDDTRALLDQLMGKDRNRALDEESKIKVTWKDKQCCKWDLVVFCPNNLFVNTKSDLGMCRYEICPVDEVRKNQFNEEPPEVKRKYEEDFYNTLKSMTDELDAKIRRAQGRLDMAPTSRSSDRVKQIDAKVQELKNRIEELGEEGLVEEAQAKAQEVEELEKVKKQQLQTMESRAQQYGSAPDWNYGGRKLAVCEISGTLYCPEDEPSHFFLNGKQYKGWKLIRDSLVELKEKWDKEGPIDTSTVVLTHDSTARLITQPVTLRRRLVERKRSPEKFKLERADRSSRSSRRDDRDRSRERRKERRRSRSRERRRDRDRHSRSYRREERRHR